MQSLRELQMLVAMEDITDVHDWHIQASCFSNPIPGPNAVPYSWIANCKLDSQRRSCRKMEERINAEGSRYHTKYGRVDYR